MWPRLLWINKPAIGWFEWQNASVNHAEPEPKTDQENQQLHFQFTCLSRSAPRLPVSTVHFLPVNTDRGGCSQAPVEWGVLPCNLWPLLAAAALCLLSHCFICLQRHPCGFEGWQTNVSWGGDQNSADIPSSQRDDWTSMDTTPRCFQEGVFSSELAGGRAWKYSPCGPLAC